MPRKRRTDKRTPLMVTQRAKEIWKTGRNEMVVVTPEGGGLIADDELADALGVPVLVMMPNVRALLDRLE